MGSTYTDNGGIEKIGLGEQAGAWGTTTNNNFDIVDRLINGVGSISLSGTTHTLTTSDGSLSDGMFKVLVLGGSPSGTNTITIEPNNADKLYFVKNASGQSVTFTQGSGANVTILNGFGAIIFADGAGSGAAVTDLTALFTTSQAIDGVVIGGTTPAAGSFTTVTANGGVTVDNITIDGQEIDLSSGTLKIDAEGDIDLDADSGDINFQDNGTTVGQVTIDSNGGDLIISSKVSDKDFILKGNDGGSTISALTLDMSEAGNATFNGTVTTTGLTLGSTAITATGAELNIMYGVTATKDELNIMDGVTATTAELNHTDGVTSNIQTQLNTKHDAVGNGLQEDDATTVSIKNNFLASNGSCSTGTVTAFTASVPTFISGRTTSTGGGDFTVTEADGSTHSLSMRDGDSGTFDVFATLLPGGSTISGNQFTYLAVQLIPT